MKDFAPSGPSAYPRAEESRDDSAPVGLPGGVATGRGPRRGALDCPLYFRGGQGEADHLSNPAHHGGNGPASPRSPGVMGVGALRASTLREGRAPNPRV